MTLKYVSLKMLDKQNDFNDMLDTSCKYNSTGLIVRREEKRKEKESREEFREKKGDAWK